MTQVVVTIDNDGNVKVAAGGMAGSGCKALTAAIENALGATTGDTKTSEYYQAAGQRNAVAAGGGATWK